MNERDKKSVLGNIESMPAAALLSYIASKVITLEELRATGLLSADKQWEIKKLIGEEFMREEQLAFDESEVERKLDAEVKSFVERWYHSDYEIFKVYHIPSTFDDLFSNKIWLRYLIKEGVSYSFFDLIQHISPLDTRYWADLLELSSTTLLSYKRHEKQFKPWQSEKIIEMAEVSRLGLEVFGSKDKFKLWLETPNYALGNLSPLELLKDSYGKDLVISELTRINYGILA